MPGYRSEPYQAHQQAQSSREAGCSKAGPTRFVAKGEVEPVLESDAIRRAQVVQKLKGRSTTAHEEMLAVVDNGSRDLIAKRIGSTPKSLSAFKKDHLCLNQCLPLLLKRNKVTINL